MEQRLTSEQLNQVVAEAQKLAEYRTDLMDMEEVRQILQELNLPPESLEEALVQVRRRQALHQERRQKRRMIGAAIAVLSFAIAVPIGLMWRNQQTLSQISAVQDRVTLVRDEGDLQTIDHRAVPEVYYRVTLKDAPIGKKLSLTCNWIAPNSQVVNQNQYETKEITTSVWNTYCRYPINAATPTGTWTVRLLLEGRLISDESFDVK